MIAGAALLFVAAASFGGPVTDPPDACSLLDRGDLAAVQGEPYTEAKLTSNGKVSRCFYQLPTFTASVSLDLVEDGGEALWETHFGESSSDESERLSKPKEEEVEKEEIRPVRVSGVGDEAFWFGNVAGATLWVRQGDLALRVSVGGKGSQTEKIERSKRLAIKALDRIAESALASPKGDPDRSKKEP